MAAPLHILIAEDNPNDQFIYEAAVKRARLPSHTFVRDGVEAIQYLKAEGPYSDRQGLSVPALVDPRSENAANGRVRRAPMVGRPSGVPHHSDGRYFLLRYVERCR